MNYLTPIPLPESGAGNISLDPQLASASHLSPVPPAAEPAAALTNRQRHRRRNLACSAVHRLR